MLLRGDRLGDVWRIEFSFNEHYCRFEVAPFQLQFLLGRRRSRRREVETQESAVRADKWPDAPRAWRQGGRSKTLRSGER